MSYTTSHTTTFNRSHARYVATKVAADLRRMQHLYGWPADTDIEELVEELTEMLALDYLKTVEIGFERDGNRVLSLKYESRRDGTLVSDDNAGGLPRGVDVSGCDRINLAGFVEHGKRCLEHRYVDLTVARAPGSRFLARGLRSSLHGPKSRCKGYVPARNVSPFERQASLLDSADT